MSRHGDEVTARATDRAMSGLVGFGTHRGTVVAGEAWGVSTGVMPVPPARPGSTEPRPCGRCTHAEWASSSPKRIVRCPKDTECPNADLEKREVDNIVSRPTRAVRSTRMAP